MLRLLSEAGKQIEIEMVHSSAHPAEELIAMIRKVREENAGSREKSLKLLQGAGIVDENGKLTKPYKNLCFPADRE